METRYAVLIGINDYDNQPLKYCVNDTSCIMDKLKEKANFWEKNIYNITSEVGKPLKDITGKLHEAISKIKETFQEEKDSLFFYFAGHGHQENGQSYLLFHDSKHLIKNIYDLFIEMKPKMQFYVIDACESGNKTLTRKVFYEKDNYLNELIKNSSGILFLYACQPDQSAQENKDIEHGIMTNYFIEAIQDEKLYDEDGILTPGRVQEYVAKKVSTHSHFTQIPVIENNMSGYYPFAMINPKFESISLVPNVISMQNRAISSINPNRKSRLELQKISIEFLKSVIINFIDKNYEGYQKQYYDNTDAIQLSNKEILIERIVRDAEKKYKAIYEIICYKEKPIYAPAYTLNFASLFGFNNERKIERYEEVPVIDYTNEYFDSIDAVLINDNIWNVSLGIGAVTYQTKWGGVISPYFYKIEWDGEKNSIITDIKKYHYTYLIESDSFEEIPKLTLEMFSDIHNAIVIWNTQRKEELDSFKIKTINK